MIRLGFMFGLQEGGLLKDAIIIVLNLCAFTLQQLVHVTISFFKFRNNTVKSRMCLESG